MYEYYFTFKELTTTDTGLDNSVIAPSYLANLASLWVYINSAYRTPAVNKQVGGTKRSLHMQGRAADIRTKSEYMSRLRSILAKHKDELSELIEYGTFFHIAL